MIRFAFVALMSLCAGSAAFAQSATQWRAEWRLDGTDDRNCGPQSVTKQTIQLIGDDGIIIRAIPAMSGARHNWRLLDPLKDDGSGLVRALTDRNRVAQFEFAPGHGPRAIRYTAPYSICRWTVTPIPE